MKNIAVQYGIFGGVSVVAYFLAFYFAKPQLMLEPAVMWSSLLIYITFMVLATRQEHKALGEDTYPFKDALRTAFLTFVIISTIYYVFNFLLYRLDPTMLIYEKEIVIKNMRWMAEWANQDLPEAELQKFRADNRPVTIGNAIIGLLRSFIGGFVLAAPIAGIVRR